MSFFSGFGTSSNKYRAPQLLLHAGSLAHPVGKPPIGPLDFIACLIPVLDALGVEAAQLDALRLLGRQSVAGTSEISRRSFSASAA